MDKDTRTLRLAGIQTRDSTSDENGIGQISGYAALFDVASEDMGFIEYMKPGSFDGVDMSKVLALYNHNYDNILARVEAGTLSLNVDKKGLSFTLTVPDTTVGRDVYENAKNGNLQGCSFGFVIGNDDWERGEDGELIHTITQIEELFEISIVTLPAYTETSIQVTRARDTQDAAYREHAKLSLELWGV